MNLPRLFCRISLVWLVFALLPAIASNPSLRFSAQTPQVSLDGRLTHYADASGDLAFAAVSQPDFVQQHFKPLRGTRSLGYDTQAHWFRGQLDPELNAPQRVVLSIGTPELENVDVWVQQPNGRYQHYALGYYRPYQDRPIRTRLFALATDIFPGMQLYFRVRTTNAINVHATLWQVNAYTANETRSNFYRGGYFGILLIVVAFYLILGARLRDSVMLSYAGYVASQLLFHLGTNGYLPVLLEEDTQWFTDALPRIGWLGGSVCIVLMWDGLLGLKLRHPRAHRLFLSIALFNLAFVPFALMPWLVGAELLYAVKLANALNAVVFLVSMSLLWLQWRSSRRSELMVYFVAFIIPMLGTAINSGTNLGWLPWNIVTANFYQLTTLVHVLVMSYGLALRLQQLQRDKAEAMQQAAMATSRAEEQRRFVAMLSHEFGNPLAAIDRSVQMLQIKLPDLAPAETQRLAQIRKNADTLAGFVDHFLMTEALDHGALPINRAPCVIRDTLENAVRAQGVEGLARLRILACAEGRFSFDSTLIDAALGNLLANALRYSPPDSTVELRAQRDFDGLRIAVRDHGPGLPPEDIEKLGTPYFRATTSLGKKGSGLGYHFTRRIVAAHGGTLRAYSPAEGGLVVEMVLPAPHPNPSPDGRGV